MKPVAAVVTSVTNRLKDSWAADLTTPPGRWPWRVSVTPPESGAAAANRPAVRKWSHAWHSFADTHGLVLDQANRRIGGLAETLPTHVTVPDVHAAARIAGAPWPQRLERAAGRLAIIDGLFRDAALPTSAVRLADSLGDTDFDLAVAAAAWFQHNPLVWPGLTPRQVPVPGLHGKWLNTHLPLLQALSGITNLTLAVRPTRIHFTHADPDYRDAGGRHHDSQTLGDHITLPYQPDLLLICENKDTVVMFPPHTGLTIIEGGGTAASRLLPQIPWIAEHPRVVYWGDLDADGLVILDALRAAGIGAHGMLMDRNTYETYERFGAWTNPDGTPVPCRPRRPTPFLTADERSLYDDLTNPAWPRVRRVEQERIPLQVAADRLTAVTDTTRLAR